MQEIGVVYILKHQSGTTVKVGMTLVGSKSRLVGYTKRYELKGFSHHKDYVVPASAAYEVERHAHRLLSAYHLSGIESARELFSCDASTAEAAVEKAIELNEVAQRKRVLDDAYEDAFRASRWYPEYKELIDRAHNLVNREIKDNEVTVHTITFITFVSAPVLFFIGVASASAWILVPAWMLALISALFFLVALFSTKQRRQEQKNIVRLQEAAKAEKLIFEAKEIQKNFDKTYYDTSA